MQTSWKRYGRKGLQLRQIRCQYKQDKKPVKAFEKDFGKYFKNLKWLNLGGGHHITKQGYNIELLEKTLTDLSQKYGLQIYLEPGEAVALNAGYLHTRVIPLKVLFFTIV